MPNKRLSKNFNLNISNCATIKYGTMNKNNPQVVFISIKTWIKPLFNDENYVNVFDLTKRNIKEEISKYISETNAFSTKYIFDCDINPLKITNKMSKFVQLDIFLKQNDNDCKPINDSFFNMSFPILINEILNCFDKNDFQLTKTKIK